MNWNPPGPGLWQFDPNHWPRPVARPAAELFAPAIEEGFARAFARTGTPFETLKCACVNDVLYIRLAPLTDAAELQRRAVVASQAVQERAWEAEVRRWYDALKPARIKANLDLQAADLASMDAPGLAVHVDAVASNYYDAVVEHMELVAIGDVIGHLLVFSQQFEVEDNDVFALLSGYSPGSSDAAAAVARIASALNKSNVRPSSLDEIRSAGPDAAAALDEYLQHHGWRMLTSYDPEGRALAELPQVVVRTVVDAQDRPWQPPALGGHVDQVRSRIPPDQQARFDELLANARAAYGVRDDNEGITLLWGVGLLRRALLEVGRRLDIGDHVFVASLSELRDRLVGGAQPTDADLAARWEWRAEVAASDIPASLGEDDGPPPAADSLPPGMAEATAALLAAWGSEFATVGSAQEDGSVTGTGIGDRAIVARACVARDAHEALDLLEPGDVLITTNTTSAFNAILTLAGGLVVTSGGPNSHAALVARELGLPALIGAVGATDVIRHGQTVSLDPVAGVIRPVV